jgi:formylmethanofuran dehydrogenase subunit E
MRSCKHEKKGDFMRTRCESCGTWVEESYTHVINEQCLCVLCALRVEEYQDAGDDPAFDSQEIRA